MHSAEEKIEDMKSAIRSNCSRHIGLPYDEKFMLYKDLYLSRIGLTDRLDDVVRVANSRQEIVPDIVSDISMTLQCIRVLLIERTIEMKERFYKNELKSFHALAALSFYATVLGEVGPRAKLETKHLPMIALKESLDIEKLELDSALGMWRQKLSDLR